MNTSGKCTNLGLGLLALLLAALPARAQTYSVEPITEGRVMPVADGGFTQAELDQMLAPIALYPDTLLSQVLIASTYPLEVVEAARWSRQNPRLQGDEAVAAVAERDWDPSVKALVAFPELLAQLDNDLDWTRRLGDAMLYQEAQVMDSIQFLRARADAAGSLENPEFVRVIREEQTIVIEPVQTRVVHVPVYNPTVVFGNWWWPTHQPVFWAPPPFFVVGSPGFFWSSGIHVSSGFWFTNFWWPQRSIVVVNSPRFHGWPRNHWTRPHFVPGQRWQHNPVHRRGVAYRHPEVKQRHQQPRLSAGPSTRWPLQTSPTRNVRPSPDRARPDGQWNRSGDRGNARVTEGRGNQWQPGVARRDAETRGARPDVARVEQGLRGTRDRTGDGGARNSANRQVTPPVRTAMPSQRAAPPSQRSSADQRNVTNQRNVSTQRDVSTQRNASNQRNVTSQPRAGHPQQRSTSAPRGVVTAPAPTAPAPRASTNRSGNASAPAPATGQSQQPRATGRSVGSGAESAGGSNRGEANNSGGGRPSAGGRSTGGNRGSFGGERRSPR